MELIKLPIVISLITMGLYTISQKGMIFYFLRKPFDVMQHNLDQIMFARTGTGVEITSLMKSIGHMKHTGDYSTEALKLKEDQLEYLISKGEQDETRLKLKLKIATPFILCPPCMASVHTLVWFFILPSSLPFWMIIPVALIGSFFNSILSKIISKLK